MNVKAIFNLSLSFVCGSYNDEPITVERMHAYMENEGYQLDITDERMHHEIYISDFRKTEPTKLKTILRHPIKKK